MTTSAPQAVLCALDRLQDAQAELDGLRYSPHARNAVKAIRRAEKLLVAEWELPRWPRVEEDT